MGDESTMNNDEMTIGTHSNQQYQYGRVVMTSTVVTVVVDSQR
jgi:hypothetical protein